MFLFSSLLLALTGAVADAQPTTAEVRSTVERSIPYIEKQGLWWIEEKKCASCHRVGTMLWSLQNAKQHGFTVSDRLQEWTDWANDKALSKNDKGQIAGTTNKEGVVQQLFAFTPANSDPETRKKLIGLLRVDQKRDGSWKAGGQLPFQKRAKPETDAVSTMWLTLGLLTAADDPQNQKTIQQAQAFIDKSTPGKSTEWYVMKLLLATSQKQNQQRDQMIQQLQSLQHEDGGWGWLTNDPSDALGTGMALFALRKAGVDFEAEPVRRAEQFLISTQKKDGSWPVKGTKAKKKDRIEETAVYWGTTWAVLGLLECLPQ